MKYRMMYDKAVDGIMDKLIYVSRPNYLTYVAEMNMVRFDDFPTFTSTALPPIAKNA